jgi:transaldolase
MQEFNLLEKLVAVSPGMEIWWDSSPIVFQSWCGKMLAKADPADRPTLERQFRRMYNPEDPQAQLFRGVTTNPILSMDAIKYDRPRWQQFASDVIAQNPGIDKEALFWSLYREIVRLGSEMFLPLFEATGYREGYLSAQVDPRKSFDKTAMLAQAVELHAINPNVMIKVPGTSVGYEVIEELTALGISTNNTLTFVVSQLMDCADSVRRGLAMAEANGVDLTRWRSVITHMLARFGDLGGLRGFAEEKGIELTEGDVRLAELAIFKKAYHLLKDGGYPSKLLPCALRVGPTVDGVVRAWHLEGLAGADVAATCPPVFWEAVLFFPAPENVTLASDGIDLEIPAAVMDKLLRIPYFERGYAEDGYTRNEYDAHPGLMRTVDEFSRFTEEMVAFADECLAASVGGR